MTSTTTGKCVFCSHVFNAARTAKAAPITSEPTPKCRKCGYDLSGLLAARCPECGGVLERAGKKSRNISGPELREDLVRTFFVFVGGAFLVLLLCTTRVQPLQRLIIEASGYIVFGALAGMCMWLVDRYWCADDTPRLLIFARTFAAYGYVRFYAFIFLYHEVWATTLVLVLLPVALLIAVAMMFWLWDDQSLSDALCRGFVVMAFATGPPALVLALV